MVVRTSSPTGVNRIATASLLARCRDVSTLYCRGGRAGVVSETAVTAAVVRPVAPTSACMTSSFPTWFYDPADVPMTFHNVGISVCGATGSVSLEYNNWNTP